MSPSSLAHYFTQGDALPSYVDTPDVNRNHQPQQHPTTDLKDLGVLLDASGPQ